MKVDIQEVDLYGKDWRIWFELYPENVKETAILLRLATRRRKECPDLRTGFCDEIETSIGFNMNNAQNARDTGIS